MHTVTQKLSFYNAIARIRRSRSFHLHQERSVTTAHTALVRVNFSFKILQNIKSGISIYE